MNKFVVSTQRWIDQVVIGLNLCPFAKREVQSQRVRFVHSKAVTQEHLLVDLNQELEFLNSHPDIETSLIIHPTVLEDFLDYNQFLDLADRLLVELGFEGDFQLASFHPDYLFADCDSESAENYSNRSPYPMLHILREASLEKAIDSHPRPAQIPQDNIRLLRELGRDKMIVLLAGCHDE